MPSKENLHLTINTKETHPDLEQREVLDDRKSGEEKIETAESQKDIRRLYDSATAYIAQRNVQQMEEAMKSPHWREEIPPTTSLASAIEQFKQSRSGRKSIKEKARQLSWKIGGIESSNEVRALVDYIETHIPSYEHKTVSVKKEKAETIKEKYEAEGYYVRIDEFSSRKKRENEVILSMSHDVPYRPSRTEVGRIATLLHQPNDPIELLERLKDLKVYLTPYMFENEKNFEVLKEYASTPGIMDFLKKMQGAGIKSRYMTMSRGFGSSEKSIEQIRETVKDPEKVAVFSDQVIARLSEMTRKDLELALDDFDHLQQVAEFISDDNAYRLWHTLNDSQVSGYQRGNASLFNLIRLQKSGLLDTVMEVSGNNTELASSILSHLDKKDIGQYTDSPEELTDAVKARIHSPEVQKLASDPKFREFITQASVLIDKRINLEDLELYRPLYEQGSTGIAFLEVCRESGITITDQHLRQYPLSDFLPKQAMKVLSRPDFPHFVQQLQEQLSYKATLRDLLDYDSLGYNYEEARKTGGQLSYFFQNKTLKNILTTQEGAQLIHLFGPFDARKTNLYEWIGSIPHAYNILNQLKQSFDFDPELINHNFYLIESLRRVCDKESLRQSLFNPETQDFYEKMRDIYAYQLILPQVEQFVEAAQDNNLAATIFKPENIPFIKEVCVLGTGQYVFESLQRFKRLDPGMKELVGTLHRDFKFSIDHTFDAVLPKLNILKESPVMLPTAHMLREHGFSFDIIQELDRLEHTIEYGLENAIIRQEGHPQLQRFIFENTKDLAKIPQEKLDSYLEVLMSIDDSPSQEIQRLRSSLLQQIIHTSDPAATYRKVESVFVKNNLPTVGKAYKVFEMFYTPDVIEQKLKTGNHGSPVLTSASRRRRQDIIYRDLMRIHIDSANRSLRQYTEVLKEGEPLMQKADTHGIELLTVQEQRQFQYLLDKFDTLFINSALGKDADLSALHNTSLDERYAQLKESLGVHPNQNITERISQMFLRPVGLDSIDSMLERMKEAKREAHERGLQMAISATDGALNLQEGDFLKGVDAQFISNILQNGSVAKEYLGASSSTDSTPLDTDVARVEDTFAGQGVKSVIEHSMASNYGSLLFALKDRDQFQRTRAGSKASYDPGKLELFETGGGQHYGVRTGFPATQIDFIIARPHIAESPRDIEKVYYEIAQNGYYIPVTNEQGSIIFSPEMYGEYRHTFDGLERFDGDSLVINRISEQDTLFDHLQRIKEAKKGDTERIAALSFPIKKLVTDVLSQRRTQLKEKFDTGLLGAELLDIGSTGRDTNMPGDADFDFTLKLDTKDFIHAAEIAHDILSGMEFDNNNSHSEANGYYQLRAKGVKKIGDSIFEQPIDIDIGFTKKSDLSVFGSHDAIAEKLDWIAKNKGEEIKEEVIAHIVLAKQILKDGHAYKRAEHGGFGGIGVENLILTHEGNVRSAFRSFYEAAHEKGNRIPFEEFKKKYKILNAGMNVKRLFHDNYIENMQPEGYDAMLDVIEKQLA